MEGVALNYVKDLNSARDVWNIKARIICLWKKSFRWDTILLDERGRKIQACVKINLVPQSKDDLNEDSVVLIRKCGVATERDIHSIVDLDHKINFFKCDDVQFVSTFTGHPYDFIFIPFNDILADNLNGSITADAIGRISWC